MTNSAVPIRETLIEEALQRNLIQRCPRHPETLIAPANEASMDTPARFLPLLDEIPTWCPYCSEEDE
jgi:uncharacterized Zn-finger protein